MSYMMSDISPVSTDVHRVPNEESYPGDKVLSHDNEASAASSRQRSMAVTVGSEGT